MLTFATRYTDIEWAMINVPCEISSSIALRRTDMHTGQSAVLLPQGKKTETLQEKNLQDSIAIYPRSQVMMPLKPHQHIDSTGLTRVQRCESSHAFQTSG